MLRWLLVFLFGLFVFKLIVSGDQTISLPAGVLAANEPLQSKATLQPFAFRNYDITPLADFTIQAKVLARRDYRFGREADLSPTDLALGWGQMSDQSVVDQIKIRQSSRWYRWSVETYPIPKQQIEQQSANMHMIPATRRVAKALSSIKVGEIITIDGSLIMASANDGWRWRSSLRRDDTGAGACELILIDSLTIHPSTPLN